MHGLHQTQRNRKKYISRINEALIILFFGNLIELDRRQHGKYDKINEKNEYNSVFKVFTNNDHKHSHVRQIPFVLNITDINPWICCYGFLPCLQKVHDNKEFSRENSKPRESRITTR